MSITKAIKLARRHVMLSRQGNQYIVYVYSRVRRETMASHPTDYWRARAMAREDLIGLALEYLQVEDAGAEANVLAHHEGLWTDLVRKFMGGKHDHS